jgi:hypothetical protein
MHCRIRPRFSPLAAIFAGLVLVSATQALAQSSVIVVDSFNRKVHVAGNANSRRPVGGLAKIATGMVALDWSVASKVGVNILAPVPAYAPQMAGINLLGLQPGDKLTIRDLIYATMMGGDDLAAIALADFVGRDHLYRLGRQAFEDRVLLAWAEAPAVDGFRDLLSVSAVWERPSLPVNGDDAMAVGAAGPQVGKLLRAAETWWIDADFPPDRDLVLAQLQALWLQSKP